MSSGADLWDENFAAHIPKRKKIFAKWVNLKLHPLHISIDDVVEDLRDGTVLLKLLEIVTGTNPAAGKRAYHDDDLFNREHRIHNVHHSLIYLAGFNMPLTMNAEDVVDGKVNATLTLMWYIILHFEVALVLNVGQKERKPKPTAAILKQVAQYCRALMPHNKTVPMTTFPKDFADGRVMLLLVHAKDYRLADVYGVLSQHNNGKPQKTIEAALRAGELLGMPRFLEAGDFMNLEAVQFLVFLATFSNLLHKHTPGDTPQGLPADDATQREMERLTAENEKVAREVLEAQKVNKDLEAKFLAAEEEYKAQTAARLNEVETAVKKQDNMATLVDTIYKTLINTKEDVEKTSRALTLVSERMRDARRSTVPPPTGWVGVACVSIENLERLWDRDPDVMEQVVVMVDQLLQTLAMQGAGYAQRDNSCDIFIFPDMMRAAQFCLAVQLRLLEMDWPPRILDMPEGKPERSADGSQLWRGLRIRMGLNYGIPLTEVSEENGAVEYYGPPISLAIRLMRTAHGGQTLITENAFMQIADSLDAQQMQVFHQQLGMIEVQPGAPMMRIFQLLSDHLVERRFPPVTVPDAADATDSLTDRKVALLHARNESCRRTLETLTNESKTLADNVTKLTSGFKDIEFDYAADKGERYKAAVAQLYRFHGLASSLSFRVEQLRNYHDRCEEHITVAHLQFKKEKRDLKQMYENMVVPATEVVQQRTVEPDRKLQNRIAELENERKELQKKLKLVENSAATKVRQYKTEMSQLRQERDNLKFKIEHKIYEDPVLSVPLDDIINGELPPETKERRGPPGDKGRGGATANRLGVNSLQRRTTLVTLTPLGPGTPGSLDVSGGGGRSGTGTPGSGGRRPHPRQLQSINNGAAPAPIRSSSTKRPGSASASEGEDDRDRDANELGVRAHRRVRRRRKSLNERIENTRGTKLIDHPTTAPSPAPAPVPESSSRPSSRGQTARASAFEDSAPILTPEREYVDYGDDNEEFDISPGRMPYDDDDADEDPDDRSLRNIPKFGSAGSGSVTGKQGSRRMSDEWDGR